jgi:hypothetical protein
MNKRVLHCLFSAAVVLGCLGCQHHSWGQQKIKGLSLVAPETKTAQLNLNSIKILKANWVCLMPYAYSNGSDSLFRESRGQWWGEREEGVEACIIQLQKEGFHIMIKPQLWIKHGAYTGNLSFEHDTSWSKWEQQYKAYIMAYAGLAEKYGVEMLCIGTELKTFVGQRSAFWIQLIQEVRAVYHGKLTYAANWDDFHTVPFWQELDYIGVDAYFPLCSSKTPSLKELMLAWEGPKGQLLKAATRLKKPVLFTEVGYRSVDKTADQPWESYREGKTNLLAQKNAYNAMFQTFWNEKEFAGLFIWKWFNDFNRANPERKEKGYTPQQKPAEKTLQEWFGR